MTLSLTDTVLSAVALRRGALYEYDQGYGYSTPPRVHRLTRESLFDAGNAASGTVTYVYDPVGNRSNRYVSGVAFDPSDLAFGDQFFSFDTRDQFSMYGQSCDQNGNTIMDEGGIATGDLYDAENHLISRGGTNFVVYDFEGNRARKTVNGITTFYLLDDRNASGYVQVLAEYAATNTAPDRVYAYGHDIISMVVNHSTLGLTATTNFYGFDGQGSVRLVFGLTGAVTNTYDYDAYGMPLAVTENVPNNYRYTGQQWDPDLGMYYLRARYLNPNIGRFWTADPSEGNTSEPQSFHKYLYCKGNPVLRVDPSGLADYVLALSYHGTDLGDPESWADWYHMGVYGNAFRQYAIAVPGILPNDNVYTLVKGKVEEKHLVPETDRIVRIIIAGHGHSQHGGLVGGLWSASPTTSDFETYKMKDARYPHYQLLDYLRKYTAGHCDVELKACNQALGPEGRDFMLTMSKALGANVFGYDDEYAVVGWGNRYEALSDGNFKMVKPGQPFKGSPADLDMWSQIFSGPYCQ